MEPVLLCYDGSEDARRAMRSAAALLATRDAVVLHVSASTIDWGIGPAMGPFLAIPGVDEAILEHARQVLDDGVALARELGFRAEGDLRTTGGAVWRMALDAAEDHHAGVIVAGSHGARLRERLPLGSVAHGLVSHSRRPVLVTHTVDEPAMADESVRRVLLAYDGSETADAALGCIRETFGDVDVDIATAWQRVDPLGDSGGPFAALLGPASDHEATLRAAATTIAERGAQGVRDVGLQAVPLVIPASSGYGAAIVQLAGEIESDVIVLGTHGHGFATRALLGSTAHYVVERADRPVLVVPPPLGARGSAERTARQQVPAPA